MNTQDTSPQVNLPPTDFTFWVECHERMQQALWGNEYSFHIEKTNRVSLVDPSSLYQVILGNKSLVESLLQINAPGTFHYYCIERDTWWIRIDLPGITSWEPWVDVADLVRRTREWVKMFEYKLKLEAY